MYSVIIPTIWKNLRIIELIEQYNDCPLVSEILLIDNMPEKKVEMPYYEKVKVIHSGENLYVNPSWNLGVEHAENEDIIISNDDISFDVNATLDFMKDQEYGCAGVHPISINAEDEHPLEIYDGDYIGHGWGVLLFVKKSKYQPIPSELKIWFGDNYIANTCFPNKSVLMNLYTEMSSSSSSKEFLSIIRNDILEYRAKFAV